MRIDRDAFQQVRRKTYETRSYAGIKLFVLFCIFAAIGGLVYNLRDKHIGTNPQPLSRTVQQDSAIDTPVVEPTIAEEPLVVEGKPVVVPQSVVPVLEPRVDHLSAAWISPASRRVLWQIGHLDGYPEDAEGPYSGEFGTEEASGKVVRIAADRLQEDFPQRIPPGQSIVIRFPEVIKEDLVFRGLSVPKKAPDESSLFSQLFNTENHFSLCVLCNGKTIWKRNFDRQTAMVHALIPAAYLEDYQNTLTLQNTGEKTLVFDTLWVESVKPLQTKVSFHICDWERIPDRYQGTFGWSRMPDDTPLPQTIPSINKNLIQYATHALTKGAKQEKKLSNHHKGRWQYWNEFAALHYQEKVALSFLANTIGWYYNGGTSLTLQNVTGPGRFFCGHTGMLYPSAHALWLVSKLFEGKKPRSLPINVVPAATEERPLDQVYWFATENQSGIASILITRSRSGYISGKKVRITCALPWKGTTKLDVYNGVFPDFVKMAKPTYRGVFLGNERIDDPNGVYDRNREHETRIMRIEPNGNNGGLLDIELDIEDCLLIRLQKEGAQKIPLPELPEATEPSSELPPMLLVGNVTDEREDNLVRVDRVSLHGSMLQSLCANYSIRIDTATKGSVSDQSYVVPQTTNSFYCDIDYTQTPQTTAEGAVLRLNICKKSAEQKTFSFWVYPHSVVQKEPVELRMQLGHWQGRTALKPQQWQRVELSFEKLAGEFGQKLVLLGPRPHQRHTEKLTFEFNGFALLDTREKTQRYMTARQVSPKKIAFVVLGQPGTSGQMRQSFLKPVAIQTVRQAAQAEPEKIQWDYNEHAQVLEINGLKFSETLDASVMSYLTPKEKELCSQSGLVPLVLIAETQI